MSHASPGLPVGRGLCYLIVAGAAWGTALMLGSVTGLALSETRGARTRTEEPVLA
ncbi:hypothetical protein [Streptomyces cyslabdanicus]|uniref:hypothetical protein n=1 Tax=Streptomyces cyslabdanicus TaxID=1470456 RepID=UPI0040448620